MKVLVGIVLFHPVESDVIAAVKTLQNSRVFLVFFWNSPINAQFSAKIADTASNYKYLGTGSNVGLGTAYNLIFEEGKQGGFDAVLLLDQDSAPSEKMIDDLCKNYETLISKQQKPAAIGPNPVAFDEKFYKTKRYKTIEDLDRNASLARVEFVISSGSLIAISAYEAIGPFREDFFIDAIDIEWCGRARSKGYSCWLAQNITMPHRLGNGVIRIPVIGVLLVKQPPKRIYTFIRNQLLMLRLSWLPLRWRIKAFGRVSIHSVFQILFSKEPMRVLRMVLRGWWHGLLGRAGPP